MTRKHAFILPVFVALSACAVDRGPDAEALPPIRVVRQIASTVVETPEAGGLNPSARAAVEDFFARWAVGSRGPVDVSVSAPTPEAAGHTENEVVTVARRFGAPRDVLSLAVVTGGPGRVTLVATGRQALPPECGAEIAAAYGREAGNETFGCATRRNLARMIADPTDLLRPAPSGPGAAAPGARAVADLAAGRILNPMTLGDGGASGGMTTGR